MFGAGPSVTQCRFPFLNASPELITNQPPNAPTISGGTITSVSWSLTTTAFSDPDGADTHLYTDWEVATDSGFGTIVSSSLGDTVNKLNWTVVGLTPSTQYWARARHADSFGNESANSNTTTDTTDASGSSGSSPDFEETWETGNFSNTMNGWDWDNNGSGYTGPSGSVYINTNQPYNGNYSIEFYFPPNDTPEHDSRAAITWNGGSTLAAPEWWWELYIRVPDDLRKLGGNDKFFFAWDDGVYPGGAAHTSYLLDWELGATSQSISIEFWYADGTHIMKSSWAVEAPNYFTASDQGNWVQVRHHCKLGLGGGSDPGTGDGRGGTGEYHLWKDGGLVASATDLAWDPTVDGAVEYFQNGGIFQWNNGGYDIDTYWYIDDMKLYLSDPGWPTS